LDRYVGTKVQPDKWASYTFATQVPPSDLSYAGRWRVEAQRIVAGQGARLRLNFHARNVYIVLGGRGTVQSLVDGKPTGTMKVDAYRLYTVRQSTKLASNALLEL